MFYSGFSLNNIEQRLFYQASIYLLNGSNRKTRNKVLNMFLNIFNFEKLTIKTPERRQYQPKQHQHDANRTVWFLVNSKMQMQKEQ